MSKKVLISVLCLVIMIGFYFWSSRPTKSKISTSPFIPNTSLEKRICERVSTKFGDCKKILLYDTHSNLVFAESSTSIFPVITNKEFTDFKKFIFPMLDFQEFNEEKVERGPIDWRTKMNVQKNFSIIYGFAEDDAKTIIINSEGNVQPNRFFLRDNLWVWYATFQKDKLKLPVKVTVYDVNGKIIYRGNEKK